MIHLDSSGTAYEIGKQHGRDCASAVHAAYRAWGPGEAFDRREFSDGFQRVAGSLDRAFPELLEEMRGIADGAGLTVEEIVALNCLDEYRSRGAQPRQCSSIAFQASDRGVLLGKTADWTLSDTAAFALSQRYRPAPGEGNAFFHYGCAGTLWCEGGLNESGLGMVLNGLAGRGAGGASVPTMALTRGVLQHCRDVQDALGWLRRHDVMNWGFNLTLADSSGELAFVEVVPGSQCSGRADSDYLIHTNHCLLDSASGRHDADIDRVPGYPGLIENSHSRFDNLLDKVPHAPRSLRSMQSLLQDRSPSGAISQNGEEGMHTVYAMIVAPERREIWGAEGFPPDVPFVSHTVERGSDR